MARRAEHEPVRFTPRHRRDWSRWGRWCTCGLRWATCPDRRLAPPYPGPEAPPPTDRPGPTGRTPTWDGPTAVNWRQAAWLVTPAQAWRANGGHW